LQSGIVGHDWGNAGRGAEGFAALGPAGGAKVGAGTASQTCPCADYSANSLAPQYVAALNSQYKLFSF
jgi:hypothetical protein